MGSDINTRQDLLIEEFSFFSDWMEKYEYIIALGRSIPVIEDHYKTNDYLIKGCQSQVWLHAEVKDGKVYFSADSDALITKGIIALLIKVLSGQEADEVARADLYFIDRIGLKEHLSPTRSNGLLNMIRQMKMYGLAASAKLEK
ncbi:MAG TPA: SufE family protein [Saprospiraceae bacterium]|nr:SufE family protein [Saprospiraceae bacterium]